MNYSAKDFKSDLKIVTSAKYKNDPEKALRRFNRIKGKIKKVVEGFGYKLGKFYALKEKLDNFVVHMPIIVGESNIDSDEVWDEVHKPLSLDLMDVIDEAKLDEIWGWEGTEASKKSPKDTIDLMVYLK